MVLKCCVPGCTSKGRFGFHKFPRDEGNCIKWQLKSRKRFLCTKYLPYSHYRICEKHFKANDYGIRLGRKRLNKVAVPSVAVPEDESVYEEHNYAYLQDQNGNLSDGMVDAMSTENSCNPSTSHVSPVKRFVETKLRNIGLEIGYPIKTEHPKDTTKKERIPPYVQRQLRYQAKRIKVLQQRLKDANNFGKQKVIQYLNKHFNKEQMTFMEVQLRNIGKRNHGQRYTHEEKCLMLAIYKRGPRVYRYISMLFGLPSRRTLCRHSALLKFGTGINVKLFELLKSTASKLQPLDKICTIGWDEMSLTHHLSLCTSEDYIDGFVDFGDVRIPEFATHSLTFMIRGVNVAFKQPVAYFYTQNLNGLQLAELVTLVIRAVFDASFTVIGSVCDQTSIMAAGVNRLIDPLSERVKQTGELLTYNIDGKRIIHCFDMPHVLKSIRNNLLTKGLRHSISSFYDPDNVSQEYSTEKVLYAWWDDIKEFYEFDIKNSVRLSVKLTKDHIHPENEKMKVSLATQVFSKQVGTMMLFCSQNNLGPKDDSGRPKDSSRTAYLLLFMNNLFDSLNGGGQAVANTFRGPINEANKFKYYNFWEYAILNLQKMDYIDKTDGSVNNRSTVILKLMSTVRGYMELTKMCLALGIESVSLRQMNQDGLENFFGSIRSVSHNSKSPIPSLFRPGYTNLILTNLSSHHSISSNCENDGNKSLLRNVCDLYDDPSLIMSSERNENNYEEKAVIDLEINNGELAEFEFVESEALTSVSGKVCRDIIASTDCESCKFTLEAYVPMPEHRIILAADSPILQLTYPTVAFMNQFKLLFKTVETLLPFICHEKHLLQTLNNSLNNVDLNDIGCKEHKAVISQKMKKVTVSICVTTFLKEINGILSKKITEPLPNQSALHQKAFDIVKKRKGIGKFGQHMIN